LELLMRTFPDKMMWLAALPVAIAILAFSGGAFADDKQDCIAASEAGQDKKLGGRLREAREQLLICARDVCPALLRQDCTQWLTEIISALPSVVVGARDWQGHDLVDVTVSVDGTVVTKKLDGKPIALDPGAHTFHYEIASGAPPVDEQLLIRQGERNRTLTVTFAPPPGATPISPAEEPPPAPLPARRRSFLTYVFGGVGLAAIGAGAGLGLSANSDASTAREAPPAGCAPNCPSSRVDPIKTKYILADVSFGVGIISLGMATYFFFAHPGDPAADSRHASLRLDVVSSPHGGTLGLVGRF
jgi:hypothetical protein